MGDIQYKKAKLKVAIIENDLKTTLDIAKELGLSMRYICSLAEVNVGNVCSYLGGRLPMRDENKIKIYNVIKEVLNV